MKIDERLAQRYNFKESQHREKRNLLSLSLIKYAVVTEISLYN